MRHPLLVLLLLVAALAGCEQKADVDGAGVLGVLATAGEVTRSTAGQTAPVRAGDLLSVDDQLRVGEGGHAVVYGVHNHVVARVEAGVSARVGDLVFLSLPVTREPVEEQTARLLQDGEEPPPQQTERTAGWHARVAAASAAGVGSADVPEAQAALEAPKAEKADLRQATAARSELAGAMPPEPQPIPPRGEEEGDGTANQPPPPAEGDDRLGMTRRPDKRRRLADDDGAKNLPRTAVGKMAKKSGGAEMPEEVERDAIAPTVRVRLVQLAGRMPRRAVGQALETWQATPWMCRVDRVVRLTLDVTGSEVKLRSTDAPPELEACLRGKVAQLQLPRAPGASVVVVEIRPARSLAVPSASPTAPPVGPPGEKKLKVPSEAETP